MNSSLEKTPVSENLELNIEKLPDPVIMDASPLSAGDPLEAAQIGAAIATSKLEQEGHDEISPSPTNIDTEDDERTQLLKRPNNIPCKGFHKEIIKKQGEGNRIHIYIYPPAEHADIIKAAI